MTDSEGAPIYGGVTDPAATSGPGLHYVPAVVAVCPECAGDLQDEGFAFYCPECKCSWPFNQVGFIDEGDYERD